MCLQIDYPESFKYLRANEAEMLHAVIWNAEFQSPGPHGFSYVADQIPPGPHILRVILVQLTVP